ncbi:hypothetical protein B7494_g2944 [Chlorociboria aeruginascens]|nr:hypothetical protein B7494_g2944 [Chlorociboria aeruginascens]
MAADPFSRDRPHIYTEKSMTKLNPEPTYVYEVCCLTRWPFSPVLLHLIHTRINNVSMPDSSDAADVDVVAGRDSEDDWTGVTDAASRRKRQNRLNTRTYRLSVFPASPAKAFHCPETPLLPYRSTPHQAIETPSKPIPIIIFPLPPDHLITLLQYNVLRACIINRALLTPLFGNPASHSDCSSPALRKFPTPSFLIIIPLSFYPTHLQLTVPHEHWIDIIPHRRWRDNLILAVGTFDEDELWSDTIGGLFEGFPASEVEYRGVVIWDPPWDVKGWEI